MATDVAPLRQLVLEAGSVADDLGYVALADLSHVLSGVDTGVRIIGGHMVSVLAARWQLGASLYRETGDADLGVPPVVARDAAVVDRLTGLGYERRAGDRFGRVVDDVRCASRPPRSRAVRPGDGPAGRCTRVCPAGRGQQLTGTGGPAGSGGR